MMLLFLFLLMFFVCSSQSRFFCIFIELIFSSNIFRRQFANFVSSKTGMDQRIVEASLEKYPRIHNVVMFVYGLAGFEKFNFLLCCLWRCILWLLANMEKKAENKRMDRRNSTFVYIRNGRRIERRQPTTTMEWNGKKH